MKSHDFSLGRVVLSKFLTVGIPYNKQRQTQATTLVRDSNVQLERIKDVTRLNKQKSSHEGEAVRPLTAGAHSFVDPRSRHYGSWLQST